MKYENTMTATFLDRPNRFIAHVLLEGQKETVHVKNTGRCRELLIPGAEVVLEESRNPARKTRYDLICVDKGGRLINMDSQIPNKAAKEWIEEGNLFPEPVEVQTEKTYGNSRFDLYVESAKRKAFIEVKGVTLEEDQVARFPDAPTKRGVRHVEELIRCMEDGYEAYLLFVIQMKGVRRFEPNWETHKEFGLALEKAAASGVRLLAYDCLVERDQIKLCEAVPVRVDRPEETEKQPPAQTEKPPSQTEKLPEQTGNPPEETEKLLEKITVPLLNWYHANKRTLPWRDQNNAYYTWVSEIMLQQTRVETVRPYFERFTKELPDVASLAACPEEKLMKLWEGLGYYSRVRNMQQAAVQIMEKYVGKIPGDFQTLLSLKGIGRYTAGAIASMACGKPVPAVDGNVLRIMTRLTENPKDIMKQSLRTEMEALLERIIPKEAPGDFNQALMDLGAGVCVPNGRAKCGECPLAGLCMANLHGTVDVYPVKAPKKPRRIEEKTVFVIRDGEHTAIRRRPSRGLLAGLYELPNIPGHVTSGEALAFVERLGLEPLYIEALPEAKHIFSHIEWRMTGYLVRVSSLEQKAAPDILFAEKKEAQESYAIPSAFDAYVGYMKEEIK